MRSQQQHRYPLPADHRLAGRDLSSANDIAWLGVTLLGADVVVGAMRSRFGAAINLDGVQSLREGACDYKRPGAAGGGQVGLGVAVALCSAVLYDTGFILEKQALGTLPVPSDPASILLLRTAVLLPAVVGRIRADARRPGPSVDRLDLGARHGRATGPGCGMYWRSSWHRPGAASARAPRQARERAAVALVVAAVLAIAVSADPGARLARAAPAGRFVAMVVLVVILGCLAAPAGVAVRSNATGEDRLDHDQDGLGRGAGARPGRLRPGAGSRRAALWDRRPGRRRPWRPVLVGRLRGGRRRWSPPLGTA